MEIDKKQLKIAKNYSNALLKIAKEQNSIDKFYEQLKSVKDCINNTPNLKEFFNNPLISTNDKKEIIYKIFYKDVDLQIINILNLLSDNKRLNLLETVYYCFEQSYEKINSVQKVSIESAVPLNNESKKRLQKILTTKTKSSIIPEYKVKTDIIGGLIIKINDKIIDLSLAAKIKEMEKQLI
ncbi:ATP synthase F1 subunit delta [bacterium]|nr:ATP synthase F1 subunit delta [bacterium]